MALQSVVIVPTAASPATASFLSASAASTIAPASSPGASSGTVPGQTTARESHVNPVALSRSPGAKMAEISRTVPSSPASPSAAAPPAAPAAPALVAPAASGAAAHPDGSGFDYGYLIGTVVDSRTPHAPISGATVSAEPVVGFCPSIGCVANQTGASGQFRVAASVGENEILIINSYYMTNRTWAYVTAGAIVNVGTIDLVHDAFVTGVILGSDPSHEPVGAINVTGSTRDGAFVASPSAHSNSAGDFTVAVPAVPSELTFNPIFADTQYESNVTFVNVSAGQTLNIGTVYMERTTLVSVEIVDSISGAPITGTAGAITVCSKDTHYCGPMGPAFGGPILTANAPVGPDSVDVQVAGYVDNDTSLGWVPAVHAGSAPVSMGVVAMVPDGGIQVWANISGISQPYDSVPPTSIWPVGDEVYITACELDDMLTSVLLPDGNMSSTACTATCAPPGTPAIFEGIPLRNFVNVEPATQTQCGLFPLWPIPPDLPVLPNYAWVNVTPDYLTNGGAIDLLPGTYIEGQVLPAGQQGWNVLACSTDEPNICGQTAYADSYYEDDEDNQAPENCPSFEDPNAGTTFCVMAPPGPVKIDVVSPNASSNFTWAYNPPLSWSAVPLPLSTATQNGVQSINLTSAQVTGRVLQARSQTPVAGLPAIEICPAGTPPAATACMTGAPNSTGFFKAWAPSGWDRVTASAPDYVSNGTWIYVEHSNSTGTILITPFGFIQGQVVDPSGNGLLEATVKLCPVTSPTSCSPIGSGGLASTDGFYYGAAPAGSLPRGSYQIVASAPGYSTDWSWVNVTTPGENFTVPKITLQPLLGSGVPPPGSPATGPTSGASLGAWVTGTVLDADHDIPLTTASISAGPVVGGLPTIISSIRGTGGEFNDSVPIGAYDVSVQDPGFYPVALFLNVSGNASEVDLGTIVLTPFPTVTGRLVIDPASWRTGVSMAMGLGPGPSTVDVCNSEATLCGPDATSNSGGEFNVSAPVGDYDSVAAAATGTGPGTFPGGFDSNATTVNVTNGSAAGAPPLLIGLAIFGIITGQVVDATSHGTQPVRYDGITAESNYPITATQSEVLTGDGGYAIIFPESDQLNMTVGGVGAWVPISASIPAQVNTSGGYPHLILPPGGVISFGAQFGLEHYGWLDLRVTDASTGQPVPYATVAAQGLSLLWGSLIDLDASGVANAAGYLNLTAPPSIPATSAIALNVTAPDYLYQHLSVTVNSSRTTYVNGTSVSHLGGLPIAPWGWISGQVSDALSGAPLQAVSVTVTGTNLQSGTTGVVTNGEGKFLIDAPVALADELSLALSGYSSNLSRYNVTSGSWIVAPPVHLTGDGVVEGRVVSFPGGAVVAGATVAVCPKGQPNCPNQVTTNASGFYTITSAPGLDGITVTAAGFVSNAPEYVTVTSDAWAWAGTVTIAEYAHVTGTVLGLPDVLPLALANASLCGLPSGGASAGPCFATVLTGPEGAFDVQAAAGVYVLDVNATFYNDSYLTLSLVPGETLSVGTIFVQEYGTATGTVDSSVTDAPVSATTISACEQWGSRVCTTPTTTGADGQYAISGPPGPYILQVTAAGYQSGFASVVLTSANTVLVPTFLLVPIGPDNSYTVAGSVGSATSPSVALPGAIVTATGGFSAYVGSNGEFSFVLPWGSYQLTASLNGYVAATRSVLVHGPVTGLAFSLGAMTYAVTGVVLDGLSGQPLANVQITQDGVPIGSVTSANGAFDLALPNGTHALVAGSPGGSPAYAAVPFSAVVLGAPLVHDLSLFPPPVSLDGIVADSLSGTPIVGATITVSGMTSENLPWSQNATSGVNGRFVATVYPGNYVVHASDAGFSPSSIRLQLNGTASVPVTVDLAPTSSGEASGPSNGLVLFVALVVGGAAALAVGLVLVARRPPAAPSPRAASRPIRPDP
jgi:hypothetical protein